MDMAMRRLYPLIEVAMELGVGRTTGYELIKRGDLELVKIGRRALVPAESLGRYVARLRAEQVA